MARKLRLENPGGLYHVPGETAGGIFSRPQVTTPFSGLPEDRSCSTCLLEKRDPQDELGFGLFGSFLRFPALMCFPSVYRCVVLFVLCLVADAGAAQFQPNKAVSLEVLQAEYRKTLDQSRAHALGLIASIGTLYAGADPIALPGVAKLGNYLTTVDFASSIGFDFKTAVQNNPIFWRAAIELAPQDETFPLLYASLAILGDDLSAALHVAQLSLSSLPLNQEVVGLQRKLHQDYVALVQMLQMVRFIPNNALRISVFAQAEDGKSDLAMLERRLALWPNNPLLLRRIMIAKMRLTRLLAGQGLDGVGTTEGDLVAARTELERLQTLDPALLLGFLGDESQRIADVRLAASWVQVTARTEPPEDGFLANVGQFFERLGRADVAWMVQRMAQLRYGLRRQSDNELFGRLADRLVGPDDATALRSLLAKPESGQASAVTRQGEPSPIGRGDPNMHSLLFEVHEREWTQAEALIETGRLTNSRQRERSGIILKAQILSNVGAFTEAEKSVREAVAFAPEDAYPLKILLFTLLSELDRDIEADALFTELTQADPSSAQAKFAAAMHHFGRGRFEDARRLFDASAALDPDRPLAYIFGNLATRRSGSSLPTNFRPALKGLGPQAWRRVVIAYLLGQIDAERLLAGAEVGTEYQRLGQRCEAEFLVAQIALAEGRTEDGILHLRRCIATGMVSYNEYRCAVRELKRLVPSEPREPSAGTWYQVPA